MFTYWYGWRRIAASVESQAVPGLRDTSDFVVTRAGGFRVPVSQTQPARPFGERSVFLGDSRTGLKFTVAFARESRANHRKTEVHSRLGDFDEFVRMAVGEHAGNQHMAVLSKAARAPRSGDFTRDP